MPPTLAESVDDNDIYLERFATAMSTVKAQFGLGDPKEKHKPRAEEPTRATEAQLRLQMGVVADLMSQRSLFIGDVAKTAAQVTEAASATLAVGRVSVWFLDEQRTLIRCADLYERKEARHSSGTELLAKDFPSYFKALLAERTIAAHDAHTDPRTAVFSAPYLTPLGISSMLDVPIWANGKMVGVVCHEHTGPRRTWIPDEEVFAFMMSNLMALALENRR